MLYAIAGLGGWALFIGTFLWLWHRNQALAKWRDRQDEHVDGALWMLEP